MASKFLEGQLAKQIDAAFKAARVPIDGTLKRGTAGSYNAYNDPVLTYTSYTFRGYEDGYSDFRRSLDGIPQDDRMIAIFASSCTVTPQIGDYVKLTGYDWKQIKSVETDPAKALYECQCGDASDPDA